jgi:hypothetical protein
MEIIFDSGMLFEIIFLIQIINFHYSNNSKDTSNEEPIKAHMPSWANNPNYTLHATTTKPDESQHKPVFDIFDNNNKDEDRNDNNQDDRKPEPKTKF